MTLDISKLIVAIAAKYATRRCLFLLTFLTILCSNLFSLNPSSVYKYLPSTYGLPYQEVKIKTKDSALLNVWNITNSTSDSCPTIIICGNDAGNMSNYLLITYYLYAKGFNIVLFDYRGFGKSSSFNIDSNQLYYNEFKTDYEAVHNYSKDIFKKSKIGVLGLSMGGFFPLISKCKLDFYIGDCPLLNPIAVKRNLADENLKLPELNSFVSNTFPMLIFYGFKDKIITYNEIMELRTFNENLNTFGFNGAHGETFYKLKEKYIEYINQFVY